MVYSGYISKDMFGLCWIVRATDEGEGKALMSLIKTGPCMFITLLWTRMQSSDMLLIG